MKKKATLELVEQSEKVRLRRQNIFDMKHNERFRSQLEKVSPAIRREMEWSCAIVDKIDEIIKRDGITQRDLAVRIGCNETQIVRWTRGFPNFTLASLAKLSEALGEDLIRVGL
ncbi:MAG: helix-turn-helix transcriptional regulator [Bacteroidales bacterium]|nr:helix-turn-helix transcriptional regulator [Bacteroidales bacterium]